MSLPKWRCWEMPDTEEARDFEDAMAQMADYRGAPDSERKELRRLPYPDYLRTGHWWTVRLRALYRAGFQCKACETRNHLNVHHLTYKNLGCEAEADVIVLCQPCHDFTHRLVNHGWKSQQMMDDMLRDYPRHLGSLRKQLADLPP